MNQNQMRRDTVKTIRRRILPVDTITNALKDTSADLVVQNSILPKDSLPKPVGKKVVQMPLADSTNICNFTEAAKDTSFQDNQMELPTKPVEIMNEVKTAFSPFAPWTIENGKEYKPLPIVQDNFLADPFFYLMAGFTIKYFYDCYVKKPWEKLGKDLAQAWA